MSQLEPILALSAFPPYSPKKFAELKALIAANGQLVKCVRSGKWLVDGRYREKACEELGIECQYEDLEDVAKRLKLPVLDPFVACVLLNRDRRHQDDGSLLITAASLAKLQSGQTTKMKLRQSAELSVSEAARVVGLPKRSVERMKVVLKHGAREVVEAVRTGELALSTAEDLVKHEPERQVELLKAGKNQPRGIVRALARMHKERATCSHALRLAGADVIGLQALAEYGRASADARVRAGVRVLHRIAPCSRAAAEKK